MHIVRFLSRGHSRFGVLDGDTIREYGGSPFIQNRGKSNAFIANGKTYKVSDVKLIAPCRPSKIVGIGLNYRKHAEETNSPIPGVPLIFLKPPSAVVGPEEKIVLPNNHDRVDYEGELGVVMGRKAKNIPGDKAEEYILGYTCFNDVSNRNNQRDDSQWVRAKGYDTFAPMGPWIATDIIADNLKIETFLNGALRQSSRTSDLIFGVAELISFISAVMTLLPGDVIATGTPSGIGQISPGDVIEVKIENIGTLRNFVL